jgi:hypothetical protein
LQLARLSTAADNSESFAAVLDKIPELNFDVNELNQEEQEILYAEFDEELEVQIKSEYIADPTFVIDLGHANGICPLCGHVGCRYLFRIKNIKNQKMIQCGSECIITHGLAVRGAETAEHAKKALEATIRRHIKALKIEAWHKDMSFDEDLFSTLNIGLVEIATNHEFAYGIRNSARCKARYDFPKLMKFYNRTGWLNTEKRWAEWTRLVTFVRKFNPTSKKNLEYPKPHGFKVGEEIVLETEETVEPQKITVTLPTPAEAVTVEKFPEDTEKKAEPVQLTFAQMTKELVFG